MSIRINVNAKTLAELERMAKEADCGTADIASSIVELFLAQRSEIHEAVAAMGSVVSLVSRFIKEPLLPVVARGRRPKRLTPAQLQMVRALRTRKEPWSFRKIAKELCLPLSTVIKSEEKY